MSRRKRFKCPCCGKFTLTEGKGLYEICSLCLWEDDPVQRHDPDYAGGANRLSLNEARDSYRSCGVSDPAADRSGNEGADEHEQ